MPQKRPRTVKKETKKSTNSEGTRTISANLTTNVNTDTIKSSEDNEKKNNEGEKKTKTKEIKQKETSLKTLVTGDVLILLQIGAKLKLIKSEYVVHNY